MGKKEKVPEQPAPSSPYQQLRKNRAVKIDIHSSNTSNTTTNTSNTSNTASTPSFSLNPTSPATTPSFNFKPGGGRDGKNVWMKPKNNSVQVPSEVLELLVADIERRHAGQLQAEEIVWYQGARPFKETIRTSWATGLALMCFFLSIFICVGVVFYAPGYLMGVALFPPVLAFIIIAVLLKRIRVDLYGCYALTRSRAIIVVPKKHLGFLKPIIMNFDFLTEKNLIMVQYQEARLQDRILAREPALADLVHNPHGVATVSFYPRSELAVPFRFHHVQNSHAFELDFSDTMTNTPTPVGGGRLRIEKPDFEQQRHSAKTYRIFPIVGVIWILLIVGAISGLLFGAVYVNVTDHVTIAMVVLSWFFASTLSVATFYPLYSLARGKREAKANARYVKYIIDK